MSEATCKVIPAPPVTDRANECKSSCYDTPQSNSYDTPQPSVYAKIEASEMSLGVESHEVQPEPVYAAPDEMNVINNKAYGSTATLSAQTVQSGPNIYGVNVYSLPGESEAKEIVSTDQEERPRRNCCARFMLVLLCGFLLFLVIGLASAALALTLYHNYIKEPCECATTQDAQTTHALNRIEERLNQTSKALESSHRQVGTLAEQVSELTANQTEIRRLATQVAENISHALTNGDSSRELSTVINNCTSTIEAQCTVYPAVGQCETTPLVQEHQPGSIAVSFQCLRQQTFESAPLVAVLDTTDGLATCICYVLEVNGLHRAHPVECALKVTRCGTLDLNI